MKEKCVEDGMTLARWLLRLGMWGCEAKSYEDFQAVSKQSVEALKDLENLRCLSQDERSVIRKELTYLKESADRNHSLYTGDAGVRLLHILGNPQFYVEYYKP